MNLLALAQAARTVDELLRLGTQPAPGTELLKRYGPGLADRVAGPGAGELATRALTLAEQRGWLPGQTVDAEWRQVDDGRCTLCGPAYSPAGEARLVREIVNQDYGVVYFLGREGTGKTAGSFRLAELWGRETFVMGVPQRHLPPGWHPFHIPSGLLRPPRPPRPSSRRQQEPADGEDEPEWEPDDDESPFLRWLDRHLPPRSTLLLDDAVLLLDSTAGSTTANRVIRNLIGIMRHRSLNLCINTQVAQAVTKYTLNARALFLKKPVRRWEIQEREELHPLLEQVDAWWQTVPRSAWPWHCWVDAETYSGPCHFQLPSEAIWSAAVSSNKG